MMHKLRRIPWSLFGVPLIVVGGIAAYLIFSSQLHQPDLATPIIWFVIFVGSIELLKNSVASVVHGKFALDYIALLAITTGIVAQHYIVSAVIILMLAGGNALEKYGMMMAKKSLTALTNRIPHDVQLWRQGKGETKAPIASVAVGEEIFVRRGEVIPLDGNLVSKAAIVDESSLTGEPYMMDKVRGDAVRSGTVNTGEAIVVAVTRADADSTYRKIIDMVKRAQSEKSPLIRLADQYSGIFTLITFGLCAIAYILSGDWTRVLAVLVVATPCPLILATPVALMGGMNAAARKRIIIKRLSSIEVLSRVRALFLDKTGTLTLGKPIIKDITVDDTTITARRAVCVAAAIERSSLHPFAKAIMERAKNAGCAAFIAHDVKEHIGHGISGVVQGRRYVLERPKDGSGMSIQLVSAGKRVALFTFEDEVKKGASRILRSLMADGLHLFLYTGDTQARAQEAVASIGVAVDIQAQCTPQDKQIGIQRLKKQGFVTAMVGDGINDAPALAQADVGLVFSNEEQTASSEAADIVFLGGDLELLSYSLAIAKRTIRIALESIWVGIGASVLGMVAAAMGYLPPLAGALSQEVIDVVVILNALRSSRFKNDDV